MREQIETAIESITMGEIKATRKCAHKIADIAIDSYDGKLLAAALDIARTITHYCNMWEYQQPMVDDD